MPDGGLFVRKRLKATSIAPALNEEVISEAAQLEECMRKGGRRVAATEQRMSSCCKKSTMGTF